MGKKRPVHLDTRDFDKTGDAVAFFSDMLNCYPLNARVSNADAMDLAALLKRHSEYTEKIGPGISHFEIRKPPLEYQSMSQRCFWVVRTDGSAVDISYKHCLDNKPR